MKRSVYSSAIESSSIPDSFDSIADEDMWLRLNKGLTTDLDTLDMTPFRNNQFLSQDASLVSSILSANLLLSSAYAIYNGFQLFGSFVLLPSGTHHFF